MNVSRLFPVRFLLFSALLFSFLPARAVELTDVAGRTVTLDLPVERFVLSEGRYLPLLAMLRPENPVAGLVGLMTPLSHTYPNLEKQLLAGFPQAADIAFFGSRGADSVSLEKMIELDPQVAIFGLDDHGPGARNEAVLRHLEAAGITVVFVDFRIDPLHHTVPSVELLGQVLGAGERAAEFVAFHTERVEAVRSAVADVVERPRVFLQAHPGRFECCWGMAEGMLGPFIGVAGGENIADAVAPGPTAQHSLEFLIAEDPDVWIGSASGMAADHAAGRDPVALGPGLTEADATESITRYLSQSGFNALSAVRNRRAHAVWHTFYNSPFNVVVLEAFAKWIHPDRFADTDPNRTLAEIFDRFLPFTLDGTYFSTVGEVVPGA